MPVYIAYTSYLAFKCDTEGEAEALYNAYHDFGPSICPLCPDDTSLFDDACPHLVSDDPSTEHIWSVSPNEFEPFTCPVCQQLRPFEEGSGDCQTCIRCCKCTEDKNGVMVRCMPY